MITLGKQCIAQMGAEEAGSAGDQDTMSRQYTVPLVLKHFQMLQYLMRVL
jgi:hypothetical protein